MIQTKRFHAERIGRPPRDTFKKVGAGMQIRCLTLRYSLPVKAPHLVFNRHPQLNHGAVGSLNFLPAHVQRSNLFNDARQCPSTKDMQVETTFSHPLEGILKVEASEECAASNFLQPLLPVPHIRVKFHFSRLHILGLQVYPSAAFKKRRQGSEDTASENLSKPACPSWTLRI